MNLARLKALSMMICALCKVQQVTYAKLAGAFDNDAETKSSLRRIQCLIAGKNSIRHLMADREFVGGEWIAFLNSRVLL